MLFSSLNHAFQAFPGHRGPVSCLTFRQGTSELFSGSFDRTVKIWNAEDRAYISTLFGHQSEVLTIDCLRKERVLTVGRDRSMQLWKVSSTSLNWFFIAKLKIYSIQVKNYGPWAAFVLFTCTQCETLCCALMWAWFLVNKYLHYGGNSC